MQAKPSQNLDEQYVWHNSRANVCIEINEKKVKQCPFKMNDEQEYVYLMEILYSKQVLYIENWEFKKPSKMIKITI